VVDAIPGSGMRGEKLVWGFALFNPLFHRGNRVYARILQSIAA